MEALLDNSDCAARRVVEARADHAVEGLLNAFAPLPSARHAQL